MTYSNKLKHPNWQKKRLEILNRDEFTCKLCADKNNQLHIHHLKYIPGKEPWEIDNEFLITYCSICHSIVEHFKNSGVKINLIKKHDKIGTIIIYAYDNIEVESVLFIIVFDDAGNIIKQFKITKQSLFNHLSILDKYEL